MNAHVLFLALAIAIPGVATAQSSSANHYGASEALSVHDARLGEVLMVRVVTLQNDRSFNTGSAVGTAVGYAAAQQVEGRYRDAARVAGSVVGGVAGTSVQRRLSTREAVEIYVRDFSNPGRVLVIVQDLTGGIQQGDRVFLVGSGNKTRVVKATYPENTLGSGSPGLGDSAGIGPMIDGHVVIGCGPECQGTTRPSTAIGRSAR